MIDEKKTYDWWSLHAAYSNYMYHECADLGYDFKKGPRASQLYTRLRVDYEVKYGDNFDPDVRPLDVSPNCPASVDRSIGT